VSGCHDKINEIRVFELKCPACEGAMEAFCRDGKHAVDAVCEDCGFSIPAGTPFEKKGPSA